MKFPAIIGLFLAWVTSALAAPSLVKIMDELDRTNAKIHVLKVEGQTHEYEWDAMSSSWQMTPVTSTFRLAIENKAKGRYVLTCDPAITRWTHGAAPYNASWTTEFRDSDGFVTYWNRVSQPHDGTHLLPTRIEHHEAWRRKEHENFNGWPEPFPSVLSFTGLKGLQSFTKIPRSQLDGIIESLITDHRLNLVVSDDEHGMVRIQHSIPNDGQTHDVVLDPQKGFALVRYTRTDGSKGTTAPADRTMTDEVLEYRQIADGLWHPVHCMQTIKYSEEFVALQRSRHAPAVVQYQNAYKARKTEFVLTKVTLMEGPEAENSLTVKLPEQVTVKDIRQ